MAWIGTNSGVSRKRPDRAPLATRKLPALADPKFTDVPLSLLLSREYAEERRKLIDPKKASPELRPGRSSPRPLQRAVGRRDHLPVRATRHRPQRPPGPEVNTTGREGWASWTPTDAEMPKPRPPLAPK